MLDNQKETEFLLIKSQSLFLEKLEKLKRKHKIVLPPVRLMTN